MDISNGEGVGVSLFVQGCPFHCKNCFNEETWDYNKGKEWTEDIKNTFLNLIDKPYITRISFLGGEPLYIQNLDGILDLCKTIKTKYPDKVIWLYSGYTFEKIFYTFKEIYSNTLSGNNSIGIISKDMFQRQEILRYVDVMVDGQFVDSLKDLNLQFRGSSNQRIIDIRQSLKQGRVVLWNS